MEPATSLFSTTNTQPFRYTICHVALLVLCLSMVAIPRGRADEAALRETRAMALPSAPKLDGTLDDACWQDVNVQAEFAAWRSAPSKAAVTSFRTGYDEEWLYLAVTCALPHPEYILAEMTEHDAGLHQEESIEIFLDPGTDGNLYFHFLLSPANVRAEQRVVGKKRDRDWSIPWRSATHVTENSWTAEIAIPLYVLASYGDLAQARLNIGRNAYVPRVDVHGVKIGYDRHLSHWSPVQATSHEPWNFGYLKGLADLRIQTPFLAALREPAIIPYYRNGDVYHYDVTGVVAAYTSRAGRVRLIVQDRPATGNGSRVSREYAFNGEARTEVRMPVPVATLVKRTVEVRLEDAESGDVLQETTVDTSETLQLMSAYLDRSFYVQETEATVVVVVSLPPDILAGLALVVADEAGESLASVGTVAPDTRVSLPLEQLAAGQHALRVMLQDRSGTTIGEQTVELVKRQPQAGTTVQVDQINRSLLLDGQPFFPFGMVMYGLNADPDLEQEPYFLEVAEAGFNTFLQWAISLEPRHADYYLAMAEKHGVMAMLRAACYLTTVPLAKLETYMSPADAARVRDLAERGILLRRPNGLKVRLMRELRDIPSEQRAELLREIMAENRPRIETVIKQSRQHPNLLGYFLFDEPPDDRVAPLSVAGTILNNQVREFDGYHPSFVIYSSHIPEGDSHTQWMDVLGTDPYWIPGGDQARGDINFVSMITMRTRLRGEARRQATWIVPLAEFWSGVHLRPILPAEQMCQSYLAIIHGAKGLVYFRYPFNHQTSLDSMAAVAQHMKVIGPLAAVPEIAQEVDYDPGVLDPHAQDVSNYPDVQVRLVGDDTQGYVLLAANSRSWPVKTSFTVSGLTGFNRVQTAFHDSSIEVKDGAFSETLPALATRAYRLPGASLDSEPVRIAVRTQATPQPQEKAFPVSGRPGKKNILPNPSFETASLPQWPNYIYPLYSKPRMGLPEAGFGQDSDNPYHGEVAVRIVAQDGYGNGFYMKAEPVPQEPTQYTLSLWMRAEKEGMRVEIRPGFWPSETVTLTTEWQRYSTSGVIPEGGMRNNFITLRSVNGRANDGTYWVDAMQLEQGPAATDFEP